MKLKIVYESPRSRLELYSPISFEYGLVVSRMVKLVSIAVLLLGFFSYVFAHGGCASFSTDIAKCAISSGYGDSCIQASDLNDDGNSKMSVHICGCVNAFMVVASQTGSDASLNAGFSLFKSGVALGEFVQGIDRPPIFQS